MGHSAREFLRVDLAAIIPPPGAPVVIPFR
jgi:hypothetical protein